ncbi:hypothetical protein ALP02_100823 [Pseudomonas coronafaciens pv. garcae]|nr:hypothetical protein ALP06_100928 [Pseudomonas coronafaciens pv. atropurpurea]RMV87909.1 hypothetical protein ALP02_100823 [Pseudomonas coronafaciens pv. garcae]
MYHPPARPGTAMKIVGASLLAKGPVQPQKMGRLDHGLREQAHSHRIQQ